MTDKDTCIKQLEKHIEPLQRENKEFGEIIQNLQNQLAKNSRNSSKPLPTDRCKNPHTTSSRKSIGKKNEGQKGHKGHTLKAVENLNYIQIYEINQYKHHHASLEGEEIIAYEKRQVFDIPPIQIEVTEHRVEIKCCSKYGKCTKAEFQSDATQPTQYSSHIKSLASYFNDYQFILMECICEIFEDIFSHSISEATILQTNATLLDKVKPDNKVIKQQLIDSDAVNFNESGLRVEGKILWLHVAGTLNLSIMKCMRSIVVTII